METPRNVWSQVWNELDIDEEKATLEQERELEQLLEDVQKRKDRLLARTQSSRNLLSTDSRDPRFIVNRNTYKGPHLSKNITIENIVDIISHYQQGGTIHYKYAFTIVSQASLVMDSLPNVVEFTVPTDARFTVVGDIHGQLEDLLTIFKQNDRGKRGTEVILVLYALKVLYPDYVHLNRGNHEQKHINAKYAQFMLFSFSRYGFENEILQKYDRDLLDLIQKTFWKLPVATVINKKIIVIHGGLFSKEAATIDTIKSINRKMDLPGGAKREEDRMLEELLWSDPRPEPGWVRSSRGAGVQFGPDVTQSFLSRNNLELLIRSHELTPEGYYVAHNRKLITVFSASHYCGTNKNKGAYVVFAAGNLSEPTFKTYECELSPAQSAGEDEKCQKQTLKKIIEKIYTHRHDLLYCYTQLDIKKEGKLTPEDWCNGLSSVIRLPIPWMELRPYLVKTEPDGKINYTKFVQKFKMRTTSDFASRWQESVVEKICSKIYESSGSLQSEFKKFDQDKDNRLNYEEFIQALKTLDLGLSNDQLYDFMLSIDTDRSGFIDCEEFISRFQVAFEKVEEEKQAEWLRGAVKEIGDLIHTKKLSVKEAFQTFDMDNSGGIDYQEFSKALEKFGVPYTEEQKLLLAKYVDANRSGNISRREFRHTFKIVDTKSALWQDRVAEKLSGVLHHNRHRLKAAFRLMDLQNTGFLTPEQFQEALEAVNIQLNSALSSVQIKKLVDLVEKEARGLINYKEFLDSFEIVDESDGESKPKKSRSRSSSKTLKEEKKEEIKEAKEPQKEGKEVKESKETKETKETKEHKEHKESKAVKDKEHKDIKEVKHKDEKPKGSPSVDKRRSSLPDKRERRNT